MKELAQKFELIAEQFEDKAKDYQIPVDMGLSDLPIMTVRLVNLSFAEAFRDAAKELNR